MRKLLLCAAAAMFVLVESSAFGAVPEAGDSFFMGWYEQDNNDDNGMEPIEWMVLDVQDGKALLLSRYALDGKKFHEGDSSVTWAESTLCQWLNGEFYETCFSEEEKAAVLLSDISNTAHDGYGEWDLEDQPSCKNKIFLLSYQQASRYLRNKSDREAIGTTYANTHGAKAPGIYSVVSKELDWWLRSPGKASTQVSFIDIHGSVKSKGPGERKGVRPALWIDVEEGDLDAFPYEQYQKALKLSADREYGQAADILEALGEYNNCASETVYHRYLQAIKASEDGGYEEAITLFEELDGYNDSFALGKKARYGYAVACQEAGDYEKAARLYGEVGQYLDSMVRMRSCFERLGISVYYFTEEPVNAWHNTGYAKTEKIDKDDRHFGWRLGQFFMSGFTRIYNGSTDDPVFIKTLGDSVTLWFELEQDIDALNGKKDLFIIADTNGANERFGISKTDFGKGTLIVQHTDYQNRKDAPVIYTDYLAAKGTVGAKTDIVFNEEGDYEVALDYEMQDNDITHIRNKYGNYQILFRFSVRNGNCMVYPFDVATGNELGNISKTENGFYLDLAKSRYLDIDVKYSVIHKDASGIHEDIRFNRPAKDGDRYVTEGIYTISVKNRYTGESTVKTIFVGTDELLQEYISNGFERERLK